MVGTSRLFGRGHRRFRAFSTAAGILPTFLAEETLAYPMPRNRSLDSEIDFLLIQAFLDRRHDAQE